MKNIKSLLLVGSAVLLFAAAGFGQEKSVEKDPGKSKEAPADKSKESKTSNKRSGFYGGSDRGRNIVENKSPVIHDLKLDKTELMAEPLKDEQPEQIESKDTLSVNVSVEATDPENDVLTYIYEISAGEIRGVGQKIIWDLSGLNAGSYTIRARVKDCCGLSTETITKTVTIK